MQSQVISDQADRSTRQAVRLHYLDWLRVLAVLMVFVFHAVKPFNVGDWIILNSETSIAATVFLILAAPWGMPFFFLLAGAGTWFALRRRTARQYAGERFGRLLVPFLVGSTLLTPLQASFDWRFWTQREAAGTSYLQFFLDRWRGFNPTVFSWIGYHLWFLGFLFSLSLIGLPLLCWLRGESGQAVVSRLARLCERRGGILLFILPLLLIQLSLRPFFPQEYGTADFFYYLSVFVFGYVLYADERFVRAIRRDRWLVLAVGIAALLGLLTTLALGKAEIWFETPGVPGFYFFWALATIDAWCWLVVMLFVGMRFLDVSNRWLQRCQEAIVPFYVFHQPVVVAIAFYVVQWRAGVTVKMLAVVLGSFLVTIGIYELFVRRVAPLRTLFGMKSAARASVARPQAAAPASGPGPLPSA